MKKKSLFLILPFLLLSSCIDVNTKIPDNPVIDDENNDDEEKTDNEEKKERKYKREYYENPFTFYKKDGFPYQVYCADPDIIRDDEEGCFYMYCTNTDCEMGDKGYMYDRGPIFKSYNLVDWKWCGSVFMDNPDAGRWGNAEAGIWAPSVIKVGNKYNYYYSLSSWGDSNPGIGVATSPTPYGPWTHYGKILDQASSGVRNGIDPQAIYVGDTLYLVWGSFFGIAMLELTDDGLEPFYGKDNIKSSLKYIIKDNTDGNMNIDINYEGSYIINKNNRYYYFGSQGTCLSGTESTYRVKVGASDKLEGPYYGSDKKTMDDLDGTFGDLVVAPSEDVAGTGHNTIVEDFAGKYWIVYHGYDINGDHPNDRVPFIDELIWDTNTGLPYVKDHKASIHEKKLGPTIVDFE